MYKNDNNNNKIYAASSSSGNIIELNRQSVNRVNGPLLL